MKLELILSFDSINELQDALSRLAVKQEVLEPVYEQTHVLPIARKEKKVKEKVVDIPAEKSVEVIGKCANSDCGKDFEIGNTGFKRFCCKSCYMKNYWKTYKKNEKPEILEFATPIADQSEIICPKGEERFSSFPSMHPEGRSMIQYYYRDHDGELFTTVATNLSDAQVLKDEWLASKMALKG